MDTTRGSLEECQTLISQLCSEWGLKPIKVKVSKKQTVAGGCALYPKSEIALGEWLLEVASPDEVEDVVKHEFAHFLALDLGKSDRHGPYWQEAAVACGAAPEPHYSAALNAKRIQYHNKRCWRF